MRCCSALALSALARAQLFAVPGPGLPRSSSASSSSAASPSAAAPYGPPRAAAPSGNGTAVCTGLAFAALLGVVRSAMRSPRGTTPPQGTALRAGLSQQDMPTGFRLPRSVPRGPYALSKPRRDRAKVGMDLGMQVDPVASAVSISTLAGLEAFMTKMSDLNNLEKQRDGAVESLRKAKALLLAGNLDLAAYERAAADAETLAQEYEAAKAFLTLGQAETGSGDPSAAPLSRGAAKVAEVSRASRSRNEVPQMA